MPVYSNLTGTSGKAFEIGLGETGVSIGSHTKDGILQGRDADNRTIRDLIQLSPRYTVPAGHAQLATAYEIHDFCVVGYVAMEEGAEYLLDEGAVLVV